MDAGRFDSLTRSLAAPKTRRGLLAGLVALAAGAAGYRTVPAQSACPPGQTANRKGDCRCPAGTDTCPNGCIDRKRDVNNCGSCGNVCPSDAVCRKGECHCPASGCAPTSPTVTLDMISVTCEGLVTYTYANPTTQPVSVDMSLGQRNAPQGRSAWFGGVTVVLPPENQGTAAAQGYIHPSADVRQAYGPHVSAVFSYFEEHGGSLLDSLDFPIDCFA